MDRGIQLEHLLRHLKHTEPAIEHWQDLGDIPGSTEIDGILVNAGSFSKSSDRTISGLVLAIKLLAKKCAALEQQCRDLEMASQRPDKLIVGPVERLPES